MTLYGAKAVGPAMAVTLAGVAVEIDFEDGACGVWLREEDDAFACVGKGKMTRAVEAAGNDEDWCWWKGRCG